MKNILLSTLVVVSSLCLAQPIIQSANFMPVGFSCELSVGGAISVGSAGANQIWNYSNVSATPAGTLIVTTPSNTSCGSSFPNSNFAEIVPTPTYNYFLRSASQIETLGENIPASCSGGNTYTDTKIDLKFPFAYTNTYTDPYVNTTGSGSITVTYDGYGTLITPTGTITNVARISTTDGSSTMIEWISTGNPSYIVLISQSGNSLFFSNPTVGISEINNEAKLNVYPNPSSGEVIIEVPDSEKQDLYIYNLTGQLVFRKKINGAETVDLKDLNQGVYTLTIKTNNSLVNKKLTIVH